jgi:WD40 repeat protein
MADAIGFDKTTLGFTLPWDADWVTAVSFVGTSRRVAAGNNRGEILLWDLPEKAGSAPPKPVRKLEGHGNVISRLSAIAGGKWLISASYDHSIRIWDMQAPAQKSAEVVLNARAIADAQQRKTGQKAPPPNVARVEVQTAAQVVGFHKEWVSNFSISKDEKLILSGDDAGEAVLWNLPDRQEIRRWKVTSWVQALALSPDAKQALISERRPLVFDAGKHAGVKLWDVDKGAVFKDLSADFKGMYIAAAAYSPDGKLVAFGRGGEAPGLTGKIWIYNPADGKKLNELAPGHQDGLTNMAFHPDGQHLISCGRDTLIRIWDTSSGKIVKDLGKPRGGQSKDWICAVAIAADGKRIAGGDMAGAVQVWDLG